MDDSLRWARMPSGMPTSTKQIEAKANTMRFWNSVRSSLRRRLNTFLPSFSSFATESFFSVRSLPSAFSNRSFALRAAAASGFLTSDFASRILSIISRNLKSFTLRL